MLSLKKKMLMALNRRLDVDDVFATVLAQSSAMQTAFDGLSFAADILIDKDRVAANDWNWRDNARGFGNKLSSNTTAAQTTFGGYSGTNNRVGYAIKSAKRFATRVTYTGNGVAGRQIAHDLGVKPGMIVVKRVNDASSWISYHRARGATKVLYLNLTQAEETSSFAWNNTEPTDTVFTTGDATGGGNNSAGITYVAYLFAHDPSPAGIIQCGQFTTDGSGTGSFTHAWPNGAQFAFLKAATTTGDWEMFDRARSPNWTTDLRLRANLSNAEDTVTRLSDSGGLLSLAGLSASQTFVGMFIKRGAA